MNHFSKNYGEALSIPRFPGENRLRQRLLAVAILSSLAVILGDAASATAIIATSSELSPTQIVRQTMAIKFGEKKLNGQTLDQFADSLPVKKQFKKSAGVFVTLSYRGKSRACWGNVYPQGDSIARATVYATMAALSKEYRYAPIKPSEWKMLKPQVTVIKAVEPISSIAMQNPMRDGLLVRSGGRSGVYLAGEARDAVYQLAQCKLKAGINPKEPCQLYRLRTEIYE